MAHEDDNRNKTVRLNEAYLGLLRDLSEIQSRDWVEHSDVYECEREVKRSISAAINSSLRVAI